MSDSQLTLLKSCAYWLKRYEDWILGRSKEPPKLSEATDLVRRIEKEDSPPERA